jgi:molybdopterin-guanine dinucleotide biosynthesis protein A
MIKSIMISIVIQAGGQSRRMGQDKGLVPLNSVPLIEHVISSLIGLADETIVTTNHPDNYQYLNLPLASDKYPGAGALTGLQTALEAAQGEHVFVIACDMPFVNSDLVKYIFSNAGKADVVVPHFEDKFQPLHALYQRNNCLLAIKQALSENQKRMISFYPLISIHKISSQQIKTFDPAGQSFKNINTPKELAQAEQTFTQAVIAT